MGLPSLRWELAAVCAAGSLILFAGLSATGDYQGTDQGTYLLKMRELFGGPELEAWNRPPLAPGLILAPWTWLLGDRLGLNLFAALSIIPVQLGAYYLAKSFRLGPGASLICAAAPVADPILLDTTIAGPLILAPIGLTLAGIGWIIRFERGEDPDKRFILLFGLIPWVNQTFAVITPALLGIIGLGSPRIWQRIRAAHVAYVALAVLVGAVSLNWYEDVAPWSDAQTTLTPIRFIPLYFNVNTVVAAPFVALGLWSLWKMRMWGYFSALAAIFLGGVVWIHCNHEVIWNLLFRPLYMTILLSMPPALLALRSVLQWLAPEGRGRRGLVALCLLGYFALGAAVFYNGTVVADRHGPRMTAAAEAYAKQPEGAALMVGHASSRWMSALTHRRTEYLEFEHTPADRIPIRENALCVLGLLDEPCDPLAAGRDLDVRYVGLDSIAFECRWSFCVVGEGDRERIAAAPWLETIYADGEFWLYRIREEEEWTAIGTEDGTS